MVRRPHARRILIRQPATAAAPDTGSGRGLAQNAIVAHDESNPPERAQDDATRALADELRSLMVELQATELSAGDLAEARTHIAAARACLDGPARERWARFERRSLYRGDANPVAPPLRVGVGTTAEGREAVVGDVELNRLYEGPPGHVHGGYLAGLFDDALGGVIRLVDGPPSLTGRLVVRYRQPTPLEVPLRFEAWPVRVRQLTILARARCLCDEEVTAEAEALFVRADLDRLRTSAAP